VRERRRKEEGEEEERISRHSEGMGKGERRRGVVVLNVGRRWAGDLLALWGGDDDLYVCARRI